MQAQDWAGLVAVINALASGAAVVIHAWVALHRQVFQGTSAGTPQQRPTNVVDGNGLQRQ